MRRAQKKEGIIYRKWDAAAPKAAILAVHGLGTHSGSWNFLGEFFEKKGVATYAIELEGSGETAGPKGHVDDFGIYYDAIKKLREIIKEENPGIKVFLAGQSMGGVIVFTMAGLYPALFDGIICMAPAFASKLKFRLSDYIKIFGSLLYNRKKVFGLPFTSAIVTRDAEYQKVMDSDPYEIRYATSGLLTGVLFAAMKGCALKDRIASPVLFLLSGRDELVSPEAGKKIFKSLKTQHKTLIEYPGMYHGLNVDLDRENVFWDILKWIEERMV